MLDPIARQIVSLIVAAVFGALLSYIKTQRSNTKTAIEVAEKQALNADRAIFTLVKSQIVSEWARVNKQGFVYLHDLESINSLNDVYREMNGNGAVKLLMKDVCELDIRTTNNEPYISNTICNSCEKNN